MGRVSISLILVILLIATSAVAGDTGQSDHPTLKGPYLGQQPPGPTPQVFAPGFVSTDVHEFSCCFNPEGTEFYFARAIGENQRKRIMVTRMVDGEWTAPEVALPSFEQENFEPRISSDGERMFFMGFHEVEGKQWPDIDMFYVERDDNGWGEAVHLGEPFNPGKSMFVSLTDDGTIYTTGDMDIVRARLVDGKYVTTESVGPPVCSESDEAYPFVAPDESYLIFNSFRPEGRQLLVSFRGDDGSFGEPKVIDLGMVGGCPTVSPDGKYLFFVSGRPGQIYWVDFDVVARLRSQK